MTDPADTSLVPSPDAHLGPARAALSVVAPPSSMTADPVRLQPNEAAGYLMLGSDQWDQLHHQCTVLVEGKALNRQIDTPAKAMMIAMKAIEMGVPLTAAWSGMRFIDGEVCILGKLALRLIQQRVVAHGGICRPVQVEDEWKEAIWEMCRPGDETTRQYRFTMEDAERAGLLSYRDRNGQEHATSTYKKFGNRMLRWRALANGAAYEFADVLQGCLLVEEMEHKDPAFHARESREATRTKMQPASTPCQGLRAESKRKELGREHPDVAKVCDLVHEFATLFARHSVGPDADDSARKACYKEGRRGKWQDISDRCVKGDAPTQDEARACQNILEDDIRRLKEAIRTKEAARAAQKDSNDTDVRQDSSSSPSLSG